jgi:hypothetical protein
MRELELFRDKLRLKVKDRMQVSLGLFSSGQYPTALTGIIGAIYQRLPGNGFR